MYSFHRKVLDGSIQDKFYTRDNSNNNFPWFEAFVAVIGETMGRQLFQNLIKFDSISIIIFICTLSYS